MPKPTLNSQNKARGGVTNLIASGISALQSTVMLVAISHTGTLADAGIFTFGYANANLLINLGRFGMRNYQVSDALGRFPFATYRASRYLTVCLMIGVCALYLAVAAPMLGYDFDKVQTIFLLTLFKAEDAYEDVYQGEYQRNGRLDIASAHLSIRLVLGLVLFTAAMYAGIGLNLALLLNIVSGAIYIFFEVRTVKKVYQLPRASVKRTRKAILSDGRRLLAECLPLFVMAFASFFIVNAPKYVIDAMCGDEEQAIFGYLFMPVFIVNLFANAIFSPQVSVLAKYKAKREYEKIKSALKRQMLCTGGITLVCMALAVLLGIPALELLYGVHLSGYRFMMALLMTGGGFYAASVILMIAITILRIQGGVGTKYIVLSLISLVLSIVLIRFFGGIEGGCVSYTLAMVIQCFLLARILHTSFPATNDEEMLS